MSNNEEKKQEFLNYLNKELDSISKILNETRNFHFKNLNENQKQFLNFKIKLGELSLVVGAAIGPVIIASGKEILQPFYVFAAIILYLANGILAIWKAKDTVEKQLDAYSPSVLHKLESDVYPMEFAIDKLRFDLENQEYIDEFFKIRDRYVEENTELEIPERKVDMTLDMLSFNFVFASLLLIKTVWPFGSNFYWIFFAIIILIMFILIVRSYIQAKERAIQNEFNTKKLNELKRAHVEWQKKEVLKEPVQRKNANENN